MQLNIWRGELLPNAIEFLKQEDPDIIMLQEVYNGTDSSLPPSYRLFSYLKELFPAYHAVYGAQLGDVTKLGTIDEGNAIFSKFPITDSNMTFFDIPYGTFDNHAKTHFEDNPQGVLHAKIEANGRELHAFCVHGIWGYDGYDNPRRIKMADTLISLTNECKNVIMAGDFNMDPDTKSAGKIAQNLTHVFGTTLATTFNMKHKENPGFKTAAVDMMFVSKHMKVLKKSCPLVDVSDHLPLVVELEV